MEKKVDAVKLALLKQWDEVCEPFRKLKDEKENEYINRVLGARSRKTSSGYSKAKKGW